jgi:hypothetical protein
MLLLLLLCAAASGGVGICVGMWGTDRAALTAAAEHARRSPGKHKACEETSDDYVHHQDLMCMMLVPHECFATNIRVNRGTLDAGRCGMAAAGQQHTEQQQQ